MQCFHMLEIAAMESMLKSKMKKKKITAMPVEAVSSGKKKGRDTTNARFETTVFDVWNDLKEYREGSSAGHFSKTKRERLSAIASLSRLKILDIDDHGMSFAAISSLYMFKGLKHFGMSWPMVCQSSVEISSV
jgi:hypothetical protein